MNWRILIADDNKLYLHILQKIFAPHEHSEMSDNSISFETDMFEDGKPLVEFFRAEFENNRRIPLCILDMRMTAMNGLETAEAVRSIDPEVFIIIFTGYDITHDELIKNLKRDVYFIKKKEQEASESKNCCRSRRLC